MKKITQRRIDWSSSYRLIPSRFPTIDLYEPIAPAADWKALQRIETTTNPRLRTGLGLLLPEDEGKIEQNWLVAPFVYPDPEPSPYSDGSFGYSIVAESLHSALLFAIHRRELFLKRTAEGPTRLVMRVVKVPLKAQFGDLAHIDISDPELRFQISEQRAAKSHGVIVSGPRGKDDRLAIVLRPTAFVPPAVQAQHYCFLWNGDRIHQIFQFPAETQVIDPKELLTEHHRVAAKRGPRSDRVA